MKYRGLHQKITASLVIALVLSSGIFGTSVPVSAQSTPTTSTPCTTVLNDDRTGVLTPVPKGIYSVYMQLGKRGQQANVALYVVDSTQEQCTTIGSASVTGDTWTKVGSWSMTTQPDEGVTFLVESDELEHSVDANRPTVMLVSEASPPCVPNPNCQVSVGSYTGTVTPLSNSIASNGLRVARVVSPEDDTIVRVSQYVNERHVYTTKQLEPFDLRYVTYGNQRIVSVVEYDSGQRVTIEQSVPDTHSDSFFNFLFRLYKTNPLLILVVGTSIAIWVALALLLSIIRAIERRSNWRIAHGIIPDKKRTKKRLDLSRLDRFRSAQLEKFASRGFIIASVLLFVLLTSIAFNRYIATFYQVKGASMENAYQDGSEVFVNRTAVTYGNISGHPYIPKRGEVVILHANYGPSYSVEPQNTMSEDFIIKRVIGLPGERVVIIDGKITVYTADGAELHPDTTGNWNATMIPDTRVENIDITLTQDELFVTGDNRPDSLDSRFNGAIQIDQMAGTVTLKLW